MKSLFDTHNGPLWKARLMTCPENAPCHFPEVKAKFPHQYDLLLSLHHAANDGPVVMLVTDILFNTTDKLLQGLPVDCQPVGELHDGFEIREEEDKARTALENDPARLKAALQEFENCHHVPLLIEAFGSSQVEDPWTTVFDPCFIDNDVMARIVHRCRSLGITINSFMTAVSNATLVETVRDAGLKRSN